MATALYCDMSTAEAIESIITWIKDWKIKIKMGNTKPCNDPTDPKPPQLPPISLQWPPASPNVLQ